MSPVSPSDISTQRQYLQVSLEEAQATVRAYDTKAQIVGIGYTFALNIVANVIGGLPGSGGEGPIFVLLFWAVVMAPLFLFGYVLYPSRRSAPLVNDDTEAGLERTLYVQTSRYKTVTDLQAAVARADWQAELAYEVLKVSKLREQKRLRFITALYATMLSFGALALKQFSGVV
jgi:hypothetical protein